MKLLKRALTGLLAGVMTAALLPTAALAAPPAITWLPSGVEPVDYMEETGQFIGTNGTDVVLISPTGTVTKLENPGYEASYFYFSEGLASVSQGLGKCGYIDTTGKLVIPTIYSWAGDFSEGMAVVGIGDRDLETDEQTRKYGFINRSGQLVVPTTYDYAMPFSEGLAAVTQGIKEGYIDKSGNVVIPLVYDTADSFYGGVAVVGTGTYPNHKEGMIDKTGRLIVPIEYDFIYNYYGSDLVSACKGDQLYFLDRTGKVAATYPLPDGIIEADTGHGFFSEGLSANYTADYKTEYIDTTGKVVAQYDFGRELEDGMAYVVQDGKPGFMDKTGKLAFTLQIPAGHEVQVSGMYGPRFHQGLSMVRIYKEGEYGDGENAVCGLVDKQGNQILPYQYKSISVYGAYCTVSDGTRWGIFQNPAYQSPTPIPTPTPTPSAETPSSWAAESVNSAIAAGLVPEALQSKYTQSITRAEFCALATALYEKATGAEITGRTKFNDTTDINVEKMASLNVVTGTGNGNFSPDNPLTREQAATMLARLADALGKPMTAQTPSFTDASAISSWAANAVGQVQGAKIMGDVGNGSFNPAGSYTREQSIVTMARMLELVK